MSEITQCQECLQKTYIIDLEEICGQCEHYHRLGYFGDCRNNKERYSYSQFDGVKNFNPLTRYVCVLCEIAYDE